MKLLVVEDDEALAALLRKSLTERYYQLDLANDGQAGWDLADAFEYDLILLDWMLPRLDGLSFCQRLRAKGDLTPILLMTANEAQSSKIHGLDSGADDYLVKPFDFGELLARIRALLRRGKDVATPLLTWGDVCLDPKSCEVFCQGDPLQLTAKEYGILELFLRHPQRIFNTGALLDSLWDFEDAPSDNAVRAHIKTLRSKLRRAGVEDMLETIYGLGYRLKAAPDRKIRVDTADDSLGPSRSTVHSDSHALSQRMPSSPTVGSPQSLSAHPLPNQAPVRAGMGTLTSPAPPITASSRAAASSSHSAAVRPATPLAKTVTETSAAALRQVWVMARQQYLEKLTQAESAIASAQSNLPLSEDIYQQARRNLHSLKGGLGTFGLHQASELAAQVQKELDQLWATSSQHVLDSPVLEPLSEQLATVRQLLEAAVTPCITLSESPMPTIGNCLVLTQDATLWQALSQEAIAWDVALAQVEQWEDLAAAVERHEPLGLVLDWSNGPSDSTKLPDLLASLPQQIPMIALTESVDLEALVRVSRLGCDRYLPRTSSSFQILSSVAEILKAVHSLDAKILVVDDDRALLQRVRQILTPWGLSLTLLDEPKNFLHTLEENIPDLVILDYEMPAFSGTDLCRVLRSSPQWENLPIVFLSAHNDPSTLQTVFEAGADDYVSKPVNAPELVQRVLNRLERTQLLRRLADTDSLTGLSNRRKSVQEMNRLFVLARRQQKPVSFVELDVDHFKQINDEYGHGVGDRILQQLGEHLRQTFRGEDVTARWGGEEFVLGFYGAAKAEAIARLNDLLYALQHQGIKVSPEQTLPISFSAGVAEYPQDGRTCEQLYRSADRALYQAKAAGRSRIFPYVDDSEP